MLAVGPVIRPPHAACRFAVVAVSELQEALDPTSPQLARVLASKLEIRDERPITDAAVVQALSAAAHLTLNGVATREKWAVVDKSNTAVFPAGFVQWLDAELSAAAPPAPAVAPVSGSLG